MSQSETGETQIVMTSSGKDGKFISLDRILMVAVTIIGALTTIIWGIVWSNMTNLQTRVGVLEGDKRVIEQQLKGIIDSQKDIKDEVRDIKSGVEQIRIKVK